MTVVGGSCTAVSFVGAPVLTSGTVAVAGDGPVTVPATTVTSAGCYNFTAILTGPGYAAPAEIPPGEPANIVLAEIAQTPVAPAAPILPETGQTTWSLVAGLTLVALGALLVTLTRWRRQ